MIVCLKVTYLTLAAWRCMHIENPDGKEIKLMTNEPTKRSSETLRVAKLYAKRGPDSSWINSFYSVHLTQPRYSD